MKIQTKESFPAAHFVQTAAEDSPCRRLHGHTWTVIVTIEGKTQPDGMVVDFRDIKALIKQLDHKTLIPLNMYQENPSNFIAEDPLWGGNYKIYISDKSYSIPKEDVKLLAIEAVTAENLAEYFLKSITRDFFTNKITVQVWESENSYAEVSSI